MAETPGTFKDKLVLVVLEKLLFALVLAIVGFAFTINADRIRTAWEQGEKIATARIDAYRELLESAYDLQRELQIFYQPSPAFGMDILDSELSEYELRWLQAIGDSSGVGRSHWTTIDIIIKHLQEIRAIRKKHGFIISDRIDHALDEHIRVVWADIKRFIEIREGGKSMEQTEETEAWSRAQASFVRLRTLIRDSLGVNQLPVGS